MVDSARLRLLFVCMGNICRSPTAEGVAAKLILERGLSTQVEIDSAGTHGYHIGAAPDRRSQAAAHKRGIDLSDLRARAVEPADFERFDLLLAMDERNFDNLKTMAAQSDGSARVFRLLDFAGGGEVPDPYYGPGDGFERVLNAIEAGCRGLFDQLEANELSRN